MMYAFEKVHLLGLLSRLDSSTMSNSVEGRVPFVDHRLVEFAFTIPIKYKLKWVNEGALNESKLMMSDEISERYDVPKYILKKSYEDLLPDAILYRRKVGFPIPLGGLMWNDLKKFASDVLLSKKSLNRKIVNFENINKLLDGVSIIPDAEAAMKIWMLLNLELFCRKYFDS